MGSTHATYGNLLVAHFLLHPIAASVCQVVEWGAWDRDPVDSMTLPQGLRNMYSHDDVTFESLILDVFCEHGNPHVFMAELLRSLELGNIAKLPLGICQVH